MKKLRLELDAAEMQLKAILPESIKSERFIRSVIVTVSASPTLLTADRRSLFDALFRCAGDGLLPDGREAALTYMRRTNSVQYIPMLNGILKRLRNSGIIHSVQTEMIYSKDHFEWIQGTEQRIIHKPYFPGDRGEPTGVYALVKFKDGTFQFEIMSMADLKKIKGASRGVGDTPWVTWFDQMARKAVFKRLSKWLPLDSSVQDLIAYDNEIETGYKAEAALEAKTSKLDALANMADEEESEDD